MDCHILSNSPFLCLCQGNGLPASFAYQIRYERQSMLLKEILNPLQIKRDQTVLTCRDPACQVIDFGQDNNLFIIP